MGAGFSHFLNSEKHFASDIWYILEAKENMKAFFFLFWCAPLSLAKSVNSAWLIAKARHPAVLKCHRTLPQMLWLDSIWKNPWSNFVKQAVTLEGTGLHDVFGLSKFASGKEFPDSGRKKHIFTCCESKSVSASSGIRKTCLSPSTLQQNNLKASHTDF